MNYGEKTKIGEINIGPYNLIIFRGIIAEVHPNNVSSEPLHDEECKKILRRVGKYLYNQGIDKKGDWHIDIFNELGFDKDVECQPDGFMNA